jgi:Zinc dependent phospholipase C
VPGTIAHLYLARKFLESDQQLITKRYEREFLFGSIFPDIGYFPGKDPLLSNLAHYVAASSLPKKIFESAATEDWKAFTLGWLLHVHTDIAGHPFINQQAAQLSGSRNKEVTYEENILLHAKIETSLDRMILQNYPKVVPVKIRFPKLKKNNPLSLTLQRYYGIEFKEKEIKQAINKIDLMLNFLGKLQKWIINKNSIISLLNALKLFLKPSRQETAKAFLESYNIPDDNFQQYLHIIDEILEKWQMESTPYWLQEEYNLDTGRIARHGEYKLADSTFLEVQKKIETNLTEHKFGNYSKEILANWTAIQKQFQRNF